MKFLELTMRNWRSFQGDHHIEFSIDPDRPVTLLLGPNGAGKTTLLNAFTWAIYGEFTEGFDFPTQLVNLTASETDPSAETYVEIKLEHEGGIYTIKRSTDSRQQLSLKFDLLVTKDNVRGVEADIHRIFPKPLKDLFFFPAETFSTASVLKGDSPGQGASFDVGTAIRSLLSGDIYEHASTDVRHAIDSKTLKPPARGHGKTAVDTARQTYEQVESSLSAYEERRDVLPKLLADARDGASKAKKEAEKYDPQKIAKWTAEKEALTSNVASATELLEKADSLYVDLARTTHLHLTRYGCETAVSRLDKAEKAGLMPPRIHESVLDRALEKQICTLCLGFLTSEQNNRIEQLRENVGDAEIAIRGLEARTTLRQHGEKHNRELDNLGERIVQLSESLSIKGPPENSDWQVLTTIIRSCITVAERLKFQAQTELDRFNSVDDIEKPEEGKSPVELAIVSQGRSDTLAKESESIDQKIEKLKRERDSAFKDYKEKAGKSDDHKQKTIAIGILQEAKSYFDAAKKRIEDFGREDFEKAINTTYRDLIAKPFNIRVDPDFSIKVYLSDREEEMPLSQSEKVLLLIAFLGAIARLAPHYEAIAREGQQLAKTGGVETSQRKGFPVVLDAPTSPLDEEYELDVVNALPNLLPQIVVPVSAKSVAVWESISAKVGRAYIMELTSSATSDRVVKWLGQDHKYSTRDSSVIPARTRIVAL